MRSDQSTRTLARSVIRRVANGNAVDAELGMAITQVRPNRRYVWVHPQLWSSGKTHLVIAGWAAWASEDGPPIVGIQGACGAVLTDPILAPAAPERYEICDACLLADEVYHCVYRLYDAEDALLYVGSTSDLLQRLKVHGRSQSPAAKWWPRVHRCSFETFDSAQDAWAAEQRAISTELPLYNLRGVPFWVRRDRQAVTADDLAPAA